MFCLSSAKFTAFQLEWSKWPSRRGKTNVEGAAVAAAAAAEEEEEEEASRSRIRTTPTYTSKQ